MMSIVTQYLEGNLLPGRVPLLEAPGELNFSATVTVSVSVTWFQNSA